MKLSEVEVGKEYYQVGQYGEYIKVIVRAIRLGYNMEKYNYTSDKVVELQQVASLQKEDLKEIERYTENDYKNSWGNKESRPSMDNDKIVLCETKEQFFEHLEELKQEEIKSLEEKLKKLKEV